MFEKKTRFGKFGGFVLSALAECGESQPYEHWWENRIVCEIATHTLDCHAEIDRRNEKNRRATAKIKELQNEARVEKSGLVSSIQLRDGIIEKLNAEIDTLNDELAATKKREEEFCIAAHAEISQVLLVDGYGKMGNVLVGIKRIVSVLKGDREKADKQTADELHSALRRLQRQADLIAELRAQVPTFEKVTGKTFPVRGVYFVTHKSTGLQDACLMAAGAEISEYHDCHLILAEKDFPKPPKPELEVKVGKYEINPRGTKKTTEVVCIEDGMCCYKFHDGGSTIKPVEWVKGCLEENNATFIGEGDNQ